MLLAVGLGNPGPEYAATRHNVGFMVVDRLAGSLGVGWERVGGPALEAAALVSGVALRLLKPLTYMNLSGRAVAAALRRHNLGPGSLCVVHDDLDLPCGALRLRPGGGAGGHRGVMSIIEELGSADFARVRVGIGRPAGGQDAVDYVLSPFPAAEWALVGPVVDRAAEAVLAIARDGLAAAMNRFNSRGNR